MSSSRRFVLFGLLGLAATTQCSPVSDRFACHTDSQCIVDARQGTCEPVGACSFPDSSCPAGSPGRYRAGGEPFESCVAPLWARHFGGPGSDQGTAVGLFRQGDLAVAGSFEQTASFDDGGTLVGSALGDVFLARYSPDGAQRWAKKGSSITSFPADAAGGNVIAAALGDSSENVLIAGSLRYELAFPDLDLLAGSDGRRRLFVAAFSPSGDKLCSAVAAGTDGTSEADAMAITAEGRILVTGTLEGSFGIEGPVGDLGTATGIQDAFVYELDAASAGCVPVVARQLGRTVPTGGVGRAIAVDPAGDVVVVGDFDRDLAIGALSAHAHGSDLFAIKLSSNLGDVRWAIAVGGTSDEHAAALAVDAAGDVFVVGTFSDRVDFGDGRPLTAFAPTVFLAKYAGASGKIAWVRALPPASAIQPSGLALDRTGDVVLGGSFEGSVDFGTGARTSAGAHDVFAARYASRDGTPLGVTSLGGADDEVATAVVLDAQGSVVLTGRFQPTASFQGFPLTSRGGFDAFLVHRNR